MEGVCDCHIHLYEPDQRWTATRPALAKGDLPAYRELQSRIGAGRAVVVQPLLYGGDNQYLIAMLKTVGPDHARGIAIASPDITDPDLDSLRSAGIAGLRFFAGSALKPSSETQAALASIRALAPRLRERGMHLQINTNGSFLASDAHVFEGLDCPLVFDHLGHVLPEPGGRFTGLEALLQLVRGGNAWVKVSGLYLDSREPATGCDDMREAVQALVFACPERVIWGTNWPHPTVHAGTPVPDDALLLEQVRQWVPDEGMQRRLLHDNAADLYGFPP